jgi:hypothetical protein
MACAKHLHACLWPFFLEGGLNRQPCAPLPRISGALGWAATLDILLLFYPVPRSVFLHSLLGGDNFANLIKYHRCAAPSFLCWGEGCPLACTGPTWLCSTHASAGNAGQGASMQAHAHMTAQCTHVSALRVAQHEAGNMYYWD